VIELGRFIFLKKLLVHDVIFSLEVALLLCVAAGGFGISLFVAAVVLIAGDSLSFLPYWFGSQA
jgi:hypothetical protein